VAAQQGRGFDHFLHRLREDRADAELVDAKVAELINAGIAVIDRPRWTDDAKELASITRRTAGELMPESHATCPGHAAYLEVFWEVDEDAGDPDDDEHRVAEATYVCLDPVKYGHLEPAQESSRTQQAADVDEDARKDAAKAERRRVLDNNKAWRAAETVRRDWLKNFATRKTAPKGAARYIVAELARGDYQLRDGMEKQHAFARELLGLDVQAPRWQRPSEPDALITTLSHAADGRAQVIALTLVLGAYEATLGVHTWRNRDAGARRFTQIAAWGYELSDIEHQ
jgi:ParB family transcriptional regulator, chromosome partitioning protein